MCCFSRFFNKVLVTLADKVDQQQVTFHIKVGPMYAAEGQLTKDSTLTLDSHFLLGNYLRYEFIRHDPQQLDQPRQQSAAGNAKIIEIFTQGNL